MDDYDRYNQQDNGDDALCKLLGLKQHRKEVECEMEQDGCDNTAIVFVVHPIHQYRGNQDLDKEIDHINHARFP